MTTYNLRITLLGDCGTGKTRFCDKIVKGNMVKKNYQPSIGVDFESSYINVNNLNIKLLIWELSGDEKYDTITSIYLKKNPLNLIFCRLNDLKTIKNMYKWYSKILNQDNVLEKQYFAFICWKSDEVIDNLNFRFLKNFNKFGKIYMIKDKRVLEEIVKDYLIWLDEENLNNDKRFLSSDNLINDNDNLLNDNLINDKKINKYFCCFKKITGL